MSSSLGEASDTGDIHRFVEAIGSHDGEAFARFHIPQANGFVETSAGQDGLPAAGGKGGQKDHSGNDGIVALDYPQALLGCDIPQVNGAIAFIEPMVSLTASPTTKLLRLTPWR